MLQCTPINCINHHSPYTTTTTTTTNLPLQQVATEDINPKAPTYYDASSSSSYSWHISLDHYHEQHQQQHPFLSETHDLDGGDASYLSMEVGAEAEPIISGMDHLLNYNPEEVGGIHMHAEITQNNYDERSSEEEDYKKITVPDHVFNDLPPDLLDYLDKLP